MSKKSSPKSVRKSMASNSGSQKQMGMFAHFQQMSMPVQILVVALILFAMYYLWWLGTSPKGAAMFYGGSAFAPTEEVMPMEQGVGESGADMNDSGMYPDGKMMPTQKSR